MSEFKPNPEFEDKVRKAVSVPDPDPDFVNRLQNELARRPVKMTSRFVLKPAWAFALAVVGLAMIASAPMAVNALKRLLGYVPDVGLVENTGDLRILAEPVSVTRDGVTLSITNVMVYSDRVEVIYDVQGISAQNDGGRPENSTQSPKLFCGGLEPGDVPTDEGNAVLRFPDGTLLKRDKTTKYPQNVFAMKPVYEAHIPAGVNELTLVLDCIPWARRGAVPENWEVPFQLISIAEGTVVGEPVIQVEPTVVQPVVQPSIETSSIPSRPVTMMLEKIVPMENTIVIYFSMDMENKDPSLISIMPADAYLIDSQGQKIDLIGGFTWQPFEHRVGSAFEFRSQSKPAPGPLTVVIENAVAYYAPLYTDPPQATPDELSFTFDAGENPQYGQTWQINKDFEIAGYPVHVDTTRAAAFADVQTADFIDGSQGYEYGYQFKVQTDPSVKMQIWMDILSESCWMSNSASNIPESSSISFTQLCRDEYPKGNVRVTIGELSILVENVWQATWAP